MSLVNQVLNDLEKRGVNVSQADAAIRPVPKRTGSRLKIYLLFAAIVLGVLAVAGWLQMRGQSVAVEPVVAVAPPPPVPVASSPVPAVSSAPDQLQLVPGLAETDVAPMPVAVSGVAAAEPDIGAVEPPVVEKKNARRQARNDRPGETREQEAIPSSLPLKVVTPRQRAESEYNKANQYVREGRTDEALAAYENALLSDSNYKAARRGWVALLLNLKRNNDAERVLKRGLRRDPRDASFAMLLARLQVERNAVPEALSTLQKNLPDAADMPDYQSFMAALLQRQGQHQEAIPLFQKALALAPNNGVWMMGLGISLQAEQRKEDARTVYQRALDSKTLNPQLQEFVQQKLKEL